MTLKIVSINKNGIEDHMSICGNFPQMEGNPDFIEGKKNRKKWLEDTIEKFGTVGMIAYDKGKPAGFVECVPSYYHPLKKYAEKANSVTINCAWYLEEYGLPVRKAILDEMFGRNFFDVFFKDKEDKKCRFVDVLAVKGAPVMQYDFYIEYGFQEAIEFKQGAIQFFLLRYLMDGGKVEKKTFEIQYKKEVKRPYELTLSTSRQCWFTNVLAGKVKRAALDLGDINIIEKDYWEKGEPLFNEVLLNGVPAFKEPIFMKDEEEIKELLKKAMEES
ncbi:MAG: hypothetical protein ACE5K4_09170 [Candidatus Hydrothermarchaeota archaeon]